MHVFVTKAAQKDLRSVPDHVRIKLLLWVQSVRSRGLEETRKSPGYHDEPLKGHRAGQRSIRLSKAYRAIYVIGEDGAARFVSIEEVNKHKY